MLLSKCRLQTGTHVAYSLTLRILFLAPTRDAPQFNKYDFPHQLLSNSHRNTYLLSKRIRTHLHLHNFVLGSLAAFHMPGCIGVVARPETAPFPPCFWII